MRAIDLVERAQRVRVGIAGYDDARHPLQPYVALSGQQSPSYDFSSPGAVSEVKRALVGIAQKENTPAPDLIQDDVWDADTAMEFAIMVGRHRSRMPWALSDPFMQDGPYPSEMQPTVNGLELLAGLANALLDKTFKLATYEAWRGGAFAPPSVVSRPPSSAGVRPTYNFSPRSFLPSDAAPETVSAVGSLEGLAKTFLRGAMVSTDEQKRAALRTGYQAAVSDREALVGASIDASAAAAAAQNDCAAAGGTWDGASQTCAGFPRASVAPVQAEEPSSLGALVLLGAVGLGIYFVTRKR